MMTVSSEKDFVAVGVLAGRLQRSVRAIEATAEALKIAPAMRINGVPHFDGEQVERIGEALGIVPAAGRAVGRDNSGSV